MYKIIKRKLKSLYKICIYPKATSVRGMGDKLLILATAPSVKDYFDYESVREQFKDYDLMAVNFMLAKSEAEMHKYKPKYIILLDDIFFSESARDGLPAYVKEDINLTLEAIERIDWKCYIITPILAEWNVVNSNIDFIYLSCFCGRFSSLSRKLFLENRMNFGFNNVVIGALYYGITFGYKEIGLLGCPYRMLDFEMHTDGLHIHEHMHYYDKERPEEKIGYEELKKMNYKWSKNLYSRAAHNAEMFCQLKRYADEKRANIINYSDGSQMVAIKQGELRK